MMIKKIYILVIMFLTVINLSMVETTKAVETFEPFSYWTSGTSSHAIYSRTYWEIPADPTYLSLYIPKTSYYKANILGGTLRSVIKLYSTGSNGVIYLDSEDWIGLWETNFNGQMFLDEATLISYHFDDYDFFSIEIYQDYGSIPNFDYLRWFNERFGFTWEDEIAENWGTIDLTYYVNGEAYYEVMYDGTPDQPVDPTDNILYFAGWYDINDVLYDFTDGLLNDAGTEVGGTASLYAGWSLYALEDVDDVTDITPSAFSTFLATMGFDNAVGKLIIYFALMLIVTFFLIAYKFNAFVIIVLNILMYGVFIFMGWLPIYMIIVLGLIFGTGLFKSIKGGI